MKNYLLLLIIFSSLLFWSCGDDNPTDPSGTDPVIESINPSEVLPGDMMTLTGKNFGAERGESKIYFDNIMVDSYLLWSDNSIKVIVPAIQSSGSLKIVKSAVESNTFGYTLYNGPKIKSAGNGRAYADQEIDVIGTKFGNSKGNIYFNGKEANQVSLWADTLIKVTVPQGATSGPLTVKANGKTSPGFFFTIATDSDPFINMISPATTSVGAEMKLTGKNFGDVRGSNYVDFDGVKATDYITWTKDSIRVKVPSGAISGFVRVFVGTQSSNTLKYTITAGDPDPIITAVSKTSFYVDDIIVIQGKNFRATKPDNGDVYFNGIKALDYLQWEPTLIRVGVPSGITSGKLLVKIGDQVSNSIDYNLLTQDLTPEITNINPGSAQPGQFTYIEGKNFGTGPGTNSFVMFGTVKAETFESWLSTEIAVKVPNMTAGVVSVTVTVDGKKSAGRDFSVMSQANEIVSLVEVPAGSYLMGSSNATDGDAYPQHKVTLTKPLLVGKYEVTQQAYKKVMSQANPSRIKEDFNPVEQVTWNDAIDFCNRLSKLEGLEQCYTYPGGEVECDWDANGYRLLTEAEWEYACRAGSTGKFGNKGGASAAINTIGWTANNTATIKNAGLLAPNDFGIYDMHGNAAEWVWDLYDFYEEGDKTDPKGPATGVERCIRGGGYIDGPNFCSNYVRLATNPVQYHYYIGFRVCRKK